MFLELLSVLSFSFAICGVVLIIAKLLRLKLHKAIIPTLAALCMIGFAMWSRTTWADRTIAALPAGSTVIEAYPYQGIMEPWTLAAPRTGSLLVLDTTATLRNPELPTMALVTVQLLEQYEKVIETRMFVDCAKRRHAPAGVETDNPAGLPPEPLWVGDGTLPRLFDAVCQ